MSISSLFTYILISFVPRFSDPVFIVSAMYTKCFDTLESSLLMNSAVIVCSMKLNIPVQKVVVYFLASIKAFSVPFIV